MTPPVQISVGLLNMGVALTAIDPVEGLMSGMRLEDGYTSLHVALDRRSHFAFASELADAARTVSELAGDGPFLIGGRAEREFPRVHYLTSYFEVLGGYPGLGERFRSFSTCEERELGPGESVRHGDRFFLVCSEDSGEPISLCVGKETRGFQHRVAQFRQVSAADVIRQNDEVSELIVGGPASFWRGFLPPDAESGLAVFTGRQRMRLTALWIAAALYMEDADRYHQGFEVRSKCGRSYGIRVDDCGRPYLVGWHTDLKDIKPQAIRSMARVPINGKPKRALKIDLSGPSLVVRERRIASEAGSAHPWLASAAAFAKRTIDAEMFHFHEADTELKRAYLELARFLEGEGPSRLL